MASGLDRAAPAEKASSGSARSLTARWAHSEHARGLLLIGLFKLTKAVLSVALGVGALRLLHRDVAEFILRALDALRIDPERHIVALIMRKADLINNHQLRQFSIVTFCYAGLCLIEGTGLLLEKRWAEYFTVTLTTALLPWECYEMAKHFTAVRIVFLLLNLLVLVYLIWLLRRKQRSERDKPQGAGIGS
jgi:uncharacterized membrane protein (DUF2068 family)